MNCEPNGNRVFFSPNDFTDGSVKQASRPNTLARSRAVLRMSCATTVI